MMRLRNFLMIAASLLSAQASFASPGMPKTFVFRPYQVGAHPVRASLSELNVDQFIFQGCRDVQGGLNGLYYYARSNKAVYFSYGQYLFQLVNRPYQSPFPAGHLVSFLDRTSCEKGVISMEDHPTLRLVFEAVGSPNHAQVILTVNLADGSASLSPNRLGDIARVIADGEVTSSF